MSSETRKSVNLFLSLVVFLGDMWEESGRRRAESCNSENFAAPFNVALSTLFFPSNVRHLHVSLLLLLLLQFFPHLHQYVAQLVEVLSTTTNSMSPEAVLWIEA
jgi:hypothetical protein